MLAISAAGTPRPLRAGPSELRRCSAGELPALPKWRPRRACAQGLLPLLRRGRGRAAGAAAARRRGRGGRGWTLPMGRLRRVRSRPSPPRDLEERGKMLFLSPRRAPLPLHSSPRSRRSLLTRDQGNLQAQKQVSMSGCVARCKSALSWVEQDSLPRSADGSFCREHFLALQTAQEGYKKGVRAALKGQLDSFSWPTGHNFLLVALGFVTD
ncbi:PREDICTED: uncharacterized protein LOC101813741 isoform X2 [Ficedula albicollis]|uniref:uncharacterized protein LOC101813741 isoform X2 n=1 Tax=Ficedula albicollis TaxID=59894 RepID=UPI0007AD8485|nr:PREDICTED: uncharacterized protein LOC101813741 isoform X2 [Ficedula albicollis]